MLLPAAVAAVTGAGGFSALSLPEQAAMITRAAHAALSALIVVFIFTPTPLKMLCLKYSQNS
jgi:hypothetical protein